MIHIEPIEYPRIIEREFIVKTKATNSNKISIQIPDINIRLYYGKIFTLIIDTGSNQIVCQGTYVVSNKNNTFEHYLILDKNVSLDIGTHIVLYETFAIDNENQAATIQDIYERVIGEESKLTLEGEEFGRAGLITGLQSKKVNQSIIDLKQTTDFSTGTLEKSICKLKISDTELSKYRILLYNTDQDFIDFELTVTPNCDYYYLKSHVKSKNDATTYKLTLIYGSYNNEKYIDVKIKVSNGTVKNFKTYIGCKNYLDVIISSTVNLTSIKSLRNNFDVDKYLLFIDSYGEQRLTRPKETLYTNKKLTSSDKVANQAPGFYCIELNNKPTDLPQKTLISDTATKANLVIYSPVENDYSTTKNNVCLLITDANEIFVGNINSANISWLEFSNVDHKHIAGKEDEIQTSDDFQFISKAEKEKIVKIENDLKNNIDYINNDFAWKESVNTEADRPTIAKKGQVITVKNSTVYKDKSGNSKQVIYQYDGTDWKPISINTILVNGDPNNKNEGYLVDDTFIDKVDEIGIGTQFESNSYISVKNSKNDYESSTYNSFFDLVERQLEIETEKHWIGDNSVNIGFDNYKARHNNIVIGSGLISEITIPEPEEGQEPIDFKQIVKSQIVIGTFNESIPNAQLMFGVGTDNLNRKTLLYVDENDNLVLRPSGRLKILNIPDETYVLLSGGIKELSWFANQTDLVNVRNELNNLREEFNQLKRDLPKIVLDTICDVELCTPLITDSVWKVYKNDKTTWVKDMTGNSITVENGYVVKYVSGSWYWKTSATTKAPSACSGNWGTTLPSENIKQELTEAQQKQFQQDTNANGSGNMSVTITVEKTAPKVVNGKIVRSAEGEKDLKSASATVLFRARTFIGNVTSNDPAIALQQLQDKYLNKTSNAVPTHASNPLTYVTNTKNLTQSNKTTVDSTRYLCYAYPTKLGVLSSVKMDGATPVLDAFVRSTVKLTNEASLIMDYYVYISTQKGPYNNNKLDFA